MNNFVFVVNEEVKSESTTPQVDVSTVDSYSIEPELPNGLVFDSNTGAISGKPTQPQKLNTYTVMVLKGDEGCDARINIVIITKDPPVNLKYPKDKWILKIDSEVQIKPSCENTPTIYMSPGGLPNGLYLDPITGIVTGSPTDAIPPTPYTIVAKNQFGSSVFQVSIEVIGIYLFFYFIRCIQSKRPFILIIYNYFIIIFVILLYYFCLYLLYKEVKIKLNLARKVRI